MAPKLTHGNNDFSFEQHKDKIKTQGRVNGVRLFRSYRSLLGDSMAISLTRD